MSSSKGRAGADALITGRMNGQSDGQEKDIA
jgi:hypothetical protein